ncbi:hypothetical protein GFD17_10040 [Bifidobacterium sp. SMB2]|uniref:Uncharacterized protein n=1 Tax=Bifidobacterium saimiriisciurei TaxID=2661627 RepID=A0ABX0CIM6_9BIFI|nr:MULTISPECIES: hypothetical protein [Bifidobacterium]NEG97087.1 hypothetical protein [Bifidobacterium sp. SMB2]NEH12137.1 hypothetical protein [Bifidobacterium saimiriisciurei]
MIIAQSDGGAAPADGAAASAGDATTQTFPATAERQTASEAPTQALDVGRIRSQTAETETLPAVGDVADDTERIDDEALDATTNLDATTDFDATQPIATADATQPASEPTSIIDTTVNERIGLTTPLEAQLASVAESPVEADVPATAHERTEEAAGDDGIPTQPMIGKPAVNLAGTEPAGTAAGPQAAWRQQAAAAQGYADEAQRHGYPGSGETAQATAGPQYGNYPGWNQYTGNPSAPYTPRVEYKKGPSAGTIVWGTLLALFAFGGLASTWLFGFAMSPTVWTLLAIAALVVIGLALVIGGVVSAVRRRKTADAASATAGGGSASSRQA